MFGIFKSQAQHDIETLDKLAQNLKQTHDLPTGGSEAAHRVAQVLGALSARIARLDTELRIMRGGLKPSYTGVKKYPQVGEREPRVDPPAPISAPTGDSWTPGDIVRPEPPFRSGGGGEYAGGGAQASWADSGDERARLAAAALFSGGAFGMGLGSIAPQPVIVDEEKGSTYVSNPLTPAEQAAYRVEDAEDRLMRAPAPDTCSRSDYSAGSSSDSSSSSSSSDSSSSSSDSGSSSSD